MSTQRATQLVEAGLWLRLSGDLDGARRLFEQALKLDPTNTRARQLLDQAPSPSAPLAGLSGLPSLGGEGGARFDNPFVRPEATSPAMSAASAPPAGSSSPQPRREAFDSNPFARREPSPPPPPEGEDALTETTAPELNLDWGQATGFVSLEEATGAVPDRQFSSEPTEQHATSGWDSPSDPGLSVEIPDPTHSEVMDLVVSDEALPPPPSPPPPDARQELEALLHGARDLSDLDDHSGALELLVKAEELAPGDPEVLRCKERSEKVLQAMFESKLGRLDARPKVTLKEDEIIWLNLDHRAGFVLAQIDGVVTFEDLFSVSGMSRLDTARILSQLLEEGVIAPA